MPQFDPANFTPQVAWLVLAFAVLYFGIVRATLPKLARTVGERERQVSGDIAAAAEAKAASDRTHQAYHAEMAGAHARAHDAVSAAKAEAIRETEAKLGEANKGVHARQEQAFASLEAARRQAMADIERVAAEAAADIVDRLSGFRPDDETARAAARAALAA